MRCAVKILNVYLLNLEYLATSFLVSFTNPKQIKPSPQFVRIQLSSQYLQIFLKLQSFELGIPCPDLETPR